MKLFNLLTSREFMTYFIIGGIATIIDWSTFWLLTYQVNLHYQLSLVAGYAIASLFHYTANKFFTFGCSSKKIRSQFSLHFLVTLTSLACNIGVMSILVTYLGFNKLYARMLTTFFILLPNYLLHKYITFSKKIFFEPEIH